MKLLKRLLFIPLLLGIGVHLSAAPEISFVFGPRVGISYSATTTANFNSLIQEYFPAPERSYLPIMSQFGVNFEQRVQLGLTDSHFAFEEVIMLTGLDQSVFIPSVSLLIGFRSKAGLEFGLGPSFSVTYSDSGLNIPVTVVYAVGWTISFSDVYIPINLVILPTPADGFPRFGILTGFNFFVGDQPYE